MDDPKKQDFPLQADDILRELAILNNNLSDPSLSTEPAQEFSPEPLAGEPEEDLVDFSEENPLTDSLQEDCIIGDLDIPPVFPSSEDPFSKVLFVSPQWETEELDEDAESASVLSSEKNALTGSLQGDFFTGDLDILPFFSSSKDASTKVLFISPQWEMEESNKEAESAPVLPSEETESMERPEDEPEDEKENTTLKQEILEWVKALVVSFVALFFIFGVLIQVVTVDGQSMEPTLHHKDRLVISNLFYTPEQGDIVVLSEKSGLDKALIKRVIATEGQTLDIRQDGAVTINGLPLDEPYIKETIAENMHGHHNYPIVVPKGYVFVMGDNRNHSTDSRFSVLSFVDEDYIMGRVLLRFYPLNKIGIVK